MIKIKIWSAKRTVIITNYKNQNSKKLNTFIKNLNLQMELILRPYELQLKHTFTISRESIDVQPSLIVELKSDMYGGRTLSISAIRALGPIM